MYHYCTLKHIAFKQSLPQCANTDQNTLIPFSLLENYFAITSVMRFSTNNYSFKIYFDERHFAKFKMKSFQEMFNGAINYDFMNKRKTVTRLR
jgi:hypothetical protein